VNAGLFLLHAFLGAALVAHAFQKLLVFRLSGTTTYLESLGFRSPRRMAYLVIANELIGGILVALGLLLPLGAALIAATMLVAARTDHEGKGWFITNAGAELVVTNAVVAVVLAAIGGGRYSLDRVLGLELTGLGFGIAAVVASLAAAGVVLTALRRRARLEPVLQ
jgi:putative oxidoreductase